MVVEERLLILLFFTAREVQVETFAFFGGYAEASSMETTIIKSLALDEELDGAVINID